MEFLQDLLKADYLSLNVKTWFSMPQDVLKSVNMTGLDFYVSGIICFYYHKDGFNLHLYQERLILTDIHNVNNLYRT
jgi:hypothetical protein